MNKQELIEKIKDISLGAGDHGDTKNEHESEYALIDYILDLVNRLDEPQKVKVPAFVAPFIDKLKTTNRRYGIELEKAYNTAEDEDLVSWLWYNKNVLTLFRALENGYEVEEEPKYYIKLPGTTWGTYLVKSDDKDLLVWQNTREGTTFTEQEIKSIDERYWPFAVPVEKV